MSNKITANAVGLLLCSVVDAHACDTMTKWTGILSVSTNKLQSFRSSSTRQANYGLLTDSIKRHTRGEYHPRRSLRRWDSIERSKWRGLLRRRFRKFGELSCVCYCPLACVASQPRPGRWGRSRCPWWWGWRQLRSPRQCQDSRWFPVR